MKFFDLIKLGNKSGCLALGSIISVVSGGCGSNSFTSSGRTISVQSATSSSPQYTQESDYNQQNQKADKSATQKSEGAAQKSEGAASKSSAEELSEDGASDACSKVSGVGKDSIKVTGNQSQLVLTENSALAIRITGNQSKVKLKFNLEKESQIIPAICIFMAGNQPEIEVAIDAPVKFLYVKGRGNLSNAKIEVLEKGSIASGTVDISGHNPSVKIFGKGNSRCEKIEVSQKGKGGNYTCVKSE